MAIQDSKESKPSAFTQPAVILRRHEGLGGAGIVGQSEARPKHEYKKKSDNTGKNIGESNGTINQHKNPKVSAMTDQRTASIGVSLIEPQYSLAAREEMSCVLEQVEANLCAPNPPPRNKNEGQYEKAKGEGREEERKVLTIS